MHSAVLTVARAPKRNISKISNIIPNPVPVNQIHMLFRNGNLTLI